MDVIQILLSQTQKCALHSIVPNDGLAPLDVRISASKTLGIPFTNIV